MKLFWDDFRKWMVRQDVKTLRQLTTAAVGEFGDYAKERAQKLRETKKEGGSFTYLKHRFNAIRRVVNFGQQRGLHAADIRHATDCCAVLIAPRHRSCRDPQPISRVDFRRLLDHTTDPRMRAALLVVLNLCMYPRRGAEPRLR